VLTYDVDDVKDDSYTATVNPDGSTVVRVYYSRDTYYLSFVFQNRNNINVTDNNGSKTLNANGKRLAPEGYENVTLPTLPIKYGQHLGKRTHDFPDSQGDIFDAFLGKAPWYFNKDEFGSGQAVFNSTNMTYPVKPNRNIGDGGTITCMVYCKNGQKSYPIERRYYTSAYTWQDILDGKPTDYTTEKTAITYDLDHPHSFTIGQEAGGYKLVAVTGYEKYASKDSTDYKSGNGPLANNTEYKFKWVNGDRVGAECTVPIVLHYMPQSYSITFRQTERPGYVNGRGIAEKYRADSISSEKKFYFGEELNIEKVIASIDWEPNGGKWTTIKDENGAIYSAKDGWKGDLEDGVSFPETMPARNLVFYKEWESDTYTVTFDWNRDGLPAGTEKVFTEENIPYGDAVKNPADADAVAANREGYVLLGWKAFERNADGTKDDPISNGFYSFNTPVTKNLYLEAQWAPVNGFQVKYLAGDHGKIGADTERVDPLKYDSKAQVGVKYIATPDKDWVFIGWAIGDALAKETKEDGSKVYYGSGDVFGYSEAADLADGDEDSVITLVARYQKIDRMTSVTYHSNYPAGGADHRVELENQFVINADMTVAQPDAKDIGFDSVYTAPDGNRYRFLGWTTSEDNTKVYASVEAAREAMDVFRAGERAAAGEKDNDLYALWQVIVNETPPKTTPSNPDKPTPKPPEPPTPPEPPVPEEPEVPEVPEEEDFYVEPIPEPDPEPVSEVIDYYEEPEPEPEKPETPAAQEPQFPRVNVPVSSTPVPTADTPTRVNNTSVPRTGDDSHTALWATLCAVSAAGLAAVALGGRKRKNEA